MLRAVFPKIIIEHHAFRGIMKWAGISIGYLTECTSLNGCRYRDKPIVRLYTAAVSPTFVLMDDNAHPHKAANVDDYLERERIERIT